MSFGKKLTFLLCFVLPVVTVIGYKLGGWFNFAVPILVFGILPLLDMAIGLDPENIDESQVEDIQNDKYFRYVTYAWSFLQVGFVIWAVYLVATVSMTTLEYIGFIISVGVTTGGIGITVAHELGHKNTTFEQNLSKMVLMTVCYMHFFIEHNRGHHLNVSTPHDPASSREGESFYKFYFRTVFGSYASAWNIEKKRLMKLEKSVLSWDNEMVRYPVYTLLFAAFTVLIPYVAVGTFSLAAVGFFFFQSIVAFSLLELVNYVEHYGLRRKEIGNGKYEKVMPVHSWNANHQVSNAFLFQLQRHSDHHANAGRRYQVLRHFDESPQLPYGYEVMILLALVPPLWYKVVDPILHKWQDNYEKETGVAVPKAKVA